MGGLSIWQGCLLGEVSPGNTLLVPGCSLHDPAPDKQNKVDGWIDGQINKKPSLLSSDKCIFLFLLWFFGFYFSFLGLNSIFGFGRFWLLFFKTSTVLRLSPMFHKSMQHIFPHAKHQWFWQSYLRFDWRFVISAFFYSITLFIHYYNHWFTRLYLLLSAYVFMNKKNKYGYM